VVGGRRRFGELRPDRLGRDLPLTLTRQDQSTIIFVTIFLMPGLTVFAGVMVWWRRRLIR
jgi:hypothetical protein